MKNAIHVRVTVGEDHTIRLPTEVPAGEAEVIVLFPVDSEARRASVAEDRKRLCGSLRGQITIADDFDAPLPDNVLAVIPPT